jgi:hypothetical protein
MRDACIGFTVTVVRFTLFLASLFAVRHVGLTRHSPMILVSTTRDCQRHLQRILWLVGSLPTAASSDSEHKYNVAGLPTANAVPDDLRMEQRPE